MMLRHQQRLRKTVEIINTDAEGRLILADALHYVTKANPKCIVNFATLTGACVVALGKEISGIMGNNQELIQQKIASSKKTDELIWQLPLMDFHRDNIKSSIADIKNLGPAKGEAGTIYGAAFLREFVGEFPWAHLDIAGTAWADKNDSYISEGGTGAIVRTMIEVCKQWSSTNGSQ